MAENGNITEVVDNDLSTEVVLDNQPAPGADDQKPTTPPAGDDTAKVVEETTEQQEAKKASKFQRRLDRQKSARVAAETEARLLRERLEKLEAQSKPQPDSVEPKREEFSDYEAFLRAVARFDASQAADKSVKADREAREKHEREGRVSLEQESLAKSWNERESAFQKEAKDYLEKATAYTEEDLGELSDQARRAIVELGPQVLYKLATEEGLHDRIAAMSPLRQVAELGKLDSPVVPATKKPSSAPAPAKTGSSGRSAAPGFREDMSDAEYRELRKAQGATWAQR